MRGLWRRVNRIEQAIEFKRKQQVVVITVPCGSTAEQEEERYFREHPELRVSDDDLRIFITDFFDPGKEQKATF